MQDKADKDIILKIKNGEIDGYALIVKKYTSQIFRLIKSKLTAREDAEDLTQNVFISFYKSLKRFDPGMPVKPYLYQIARNELKMFYRSHKKVLPLDENIESPVNEVPDLPVKDDIYKNLSNREKNIFIYIDEGYKYGEISKLTGIPVNTVKSIVRRVRIKMKKYENS